MSKRYLMIFTTCLIVFLCPFASPGQDLKAIEKGANEEGQLNYYGSIRDDEAKAIFDIFMKKYSRVRINYFRSNEDKLVSKILAEAKAGSHNFDVLITTGAYHIKNLGMALKWTPPSASGINPDLLDRDGTATPVYIQTNVIQYNTREVPGVDVPKSYEDLMHAKWKGRLCLEDTDYQWFAGQMKIIGRDKALDLFKKIAANRPVIRNGHGLLSDLVSAGECPLAINQYGSPIARAIKMGAPVDFVAINLVVTIGAPAVISKNAPHPNAARLFVNWITSKEGQEFIVKNGGRIPVRTDVEPDPPRITKGLKLLPVEPLEGVELKDVQALYRQIWAGR